MSGREWQGVAESGGGGGDVERREFQANLLGKLAYIIAAVKSGSPVKLG